MRRRFNHHEAGFSCTGMGDGLRVSVPNEIQASFVTYLGAPICSGHQRVLARNNELGAPRWASAMLVSVTGIPTGLSSTQKDSI
jgi:hypothetical protein